MAARTSQIQTNLTRSTPSGDKLPTTLAKLPAKDFGYDQARHLLWRAGFGGTPAQIQTLAAWGLKKSVDHLIDGATDAVEPVKADDFKDDIVRQLTRTERLAYRRAQRAGDEDALAKFRQERQERQRSDRRQIRRIQLWWLTRLIQTPRPLEEKMTLFWHGHFATGYRKIENSYHMFLQNQRFRAQALGNYGELLFAIIRDPAMIRYLDNDRSRIGQPNENLARELMELFSLGEGNYRESDIKDGARALTGYTFEGNEFIYRDNFHDQGSKRILGASGRLDGDDFVRAILARRDCSRFIARKLYRYFVADVPDDNRATSAGARGAIAQIAQTMLASRYEIKPVLRRLFMSAHFYHDSIRNQQIKGPIQLVVGAIRSMLTPTRDLSVLIDALDLMGQNIFYPPSVKGWDGGRSWINTSTLFVRQNILSYLLTGKMPQGYDRSSDEDRYDPQVLMSALGDADPEAVQDPARVVEYLLRFTLGTAPTSARADLEAFIGTNGGRMTPDMITGVLLLITAMPEYQLC